MVLPKSTDETVPKGYTVEIIDFDNIGQGDGYPSKEAEQFAKDNGRWKPRLESDDDE